MTKITTFRDALRTFSQFHENSDLIAWAQTPTGQVLIWLFAAVLLRPFEIAKFLIPTLALVMLMPGRRRLVLSLGAIVVGVFALLTRHTPMNDNVAPVSWLPVSVAVPVLFGFLYLCYIGAKNFGSLPGVVRRRPQISLHLLLWGSLTVIWFASNGGGLLRATLTIIVVTLPFLIWRSGYMLMSGQRGNAADTGFHDHLFYLWPVYGGSNVPLGKGSDYLSQHESRSREPFARAQLAGIKLLILALVWRATLFIMGGTVFDDPGHPLTHLLQGHSLGIQRLENVINGDVSVSLPGAWASLYLELIRVTLDIAIIGHVFVGSLRLCGFNVFRNTYKPLLSESIVDFWNRFYYYFKEMLVEFFFFPTYLRYFRTRPWLRMFTAIFAAAFVGNMYYQLLRNADALVTADFAKIWQDLGPRLLYCALLSIGIFVSMVRQKKRRGSRTESGAGVSGFRRLVRIAGVWTFYGIIHIWNLRSDDLTFIERTDFFLSLFSF